MGAKQEPSMRYLAILATLIASHAHAATLPVYDMPRPNTKPLTLVNFDALAGSTVGVAHADAEPDAPLSFSVFSGVADPTAWLTNFEDYIVLQLSIFPEWELLDRELLLPFYAFPAWASLGESDALTVTLTEYAILIPDRLHVAITATDGATTLTNSYSLRVLLPEPSTAVLAIAFFFALRKRRRGRA
jgi:hypothetical protein